MNSAPPKFFWNFLKIFQKYKTESKLKTPYYQKVKNER